MHLLEAAAAAAAAVVVAADGAGQGGPDGAADAAVEVLGAAAAAAHDGDGDGDGGRRVPHCLGVDGSGADRAGGGGVGGVQQGVQHFLRSSSTSLARSQCWSLQLLYKLI